MKKALPIGLIACLLIVLAPEALAWELERPADHITINERTENAATDGKASVGVGVHIQEYIENKLDWPSNGDDDVVNLRIVATANTRNIISYGVSTDYYSWHDNLQNGPEGGTLSLGDDSGVWLWMRGIKARFYGGPNSAEYDYAWVGSNGFIGFDPDSQPTNPYYPYSIPDTVQPNTFAAPFWKDLKPNLGGSITYGKVWHWPGFGPNIECFAISWNNVPDKNSNQQTFQVLIENAPTHSMKHRQSRIWFQYKSITLDDQTTVGIEDQQGERGTSYNYLSLSNGKTLLFQQSSNSAFICYLKITLSETDPNADTKIEPADDSIRGINVILNRTLPDDQQRFWFALAGGAVLLVSGGLLFFSPPIWVAAGAFMVKASLYGAERAHDLAQQLAEARLLTTDTDNYHTYARAYGVTDPDGIFCSNAVDAEFGILAYWVLTDQNNQDHALTVKAELTYVEYDGFGSVVATTTIPTSVDLKFTADTNSFDTAKTVTSGSYYHGVYLGNTDSEDYYKVYAENGQNIDVRMDPPSDADFDLYLYNPSREQKAISDVRWPGEEEFISWRAYTPGYWYIKMTKYSGAGFYWFSVYVYTPSSGGGGCPTLLVWNGSLFFEENVLNISNPINPNDDVTLSYTLKTLPALENQMYVLKLAEIANGYNYSHSYIDHVKLYVVDEYGAWHESHLTQAEHSTHGNVMKELLFSDDDRIETIKNEKITLRFHPSIWTNAKSFIFLIEGHNPYKR